MKKIIASILVLVLILTAVSAVAANKSKGNGDMTHGSTDEDTGFWFKILTEGDIMDRVNEEIGKLKDAESPEAYFGKADDLAAILGEGESNVFEFWGAACGNYVESMGPVKVNLTFATPYDNGQTVAFLLGKIQGENIDWTAYEGEGQADGSIDVTIDSDMLLYVQDNEALAAVVSK